MGEGESYSPEALMRSVLWAVEAIDEFERALEWYAARNDLVSLRFARAVEQTTDDLAEMPFRFAEIYPGKRQARVSDFPYSLIFSVHEERILVLACFHGKRDPRQWHTRTT